MIKIPVVLTIAGSDSGGGAGIAADLKTFSTLGVHGTCVITSVTSQNTTGVQSTFDIPADVVCDQINAVCSDMDVTYAKTGMLASPDIVAKVAECVKKYDLKLVIDPVMAAEAGGDLLTKDAFSIMKEQLLPLCEVITPNVYEATALSGVDIKDLNDAKDAAKAIAAAGARYVIITGGHLDASDLVYDSAQEEFTVVSGDFVEGGTHGSGCTYSASMTAYLASGYDVADSAKSAKEFVEKAIKASTPVGHGVGPVDQVSALRQDAARYRVLEDVMGAVDLLTDCKDFADFVPEVGCNIAMAIPDASAVSDVAAVAGRIVRLKNEPVCVGCVEFGASSHIARIVLAAMQTDPNCRASVNIRYSQKVLDICKEMGLSMSSFSRAEEPENTHTMDWGVSHAIELYGGVPVIISDEGGMGKEPMVRVLGKSAQDVVKIATEVARRAARS